MGFGITLDTDSNIAYLDGTVIFVTVDNPATSYSITGPGGGGVTINAGSTYNISGGGTTLIKVAANTWCAF
jgi:carbon monoxide dehydrogenase subunit G